MRPTVSPGELDAYFAHVVAELERQLAEQRSLMLFLNRSRTRRNMPA